MQVLIGRRLTRPCEIRAALAVAVMLLHLPAPVRAQTGERGVQQRHDWTLDIQQSDAITLTLRATDVPLSDIAAELAARLKLPITVEPELRRLPVTADFDRRDLVSALRLLSSRGRVFVDYEVTRGGSLGRMVAVFFQSDTSDSPPLPVGKDQSEIHVIAGNPEDGEPANRPSAQAPTPRRTQPPPLEVKVENDRLTVRARQQPLISIVYEVAGQLGASVSVDRATPSLQELLTTPVDVQLESADIETGVLGLSPAVHLYVRRDQSGGSTRILRITLVESADRF